MKIEKIKSIKYIRNFIDFNGERVFLNKIINGQREHVKNEVIIYASNGTGKTNFSRLLNYISNEDENLVDLLSDEANSDDSKMDFSICINGKEVNKSNYKSALLYDELKGICVFNSDYVEKNIKCDNFSEKNVTEDISVPIGGNHIKINELSLKIKAEESDRKQKEEELVELLNSKTEELKSDKYRGPHPSIWSEFSLDNIVDDDFNITIPIEEDGFADCEDRFQKMRGFSHDDNLEFNLVEISKEKINTLDDIYALLEEEKVFSEFNTETEKNIAFITSNWIDNRLLKDGIQKSEEQEECLLCKRKLDVSVKDLFLEYKNYFENEKGKFEENIEGFQNKLTSLKEDLCRINNDLQDKVGTLVGVFTLENSWQKMEIASLIERIELVEKLLLFKKTNPDVSVIENIFTEGSEEEQNIDKSYKYVKNPKEDIETVNDSIEKNSKVVVEINKNIDSSQNSETALRKVIGKKYLYLFYSENINTFNDIKGNTLAIKKSNEELEVEKKNLPSKDALSHIVNFFNEFLHNFIGLDKYTAKIDDKIISLHLNSVNISKETKKISEGEKTMIGLCYFLASSIQKLNKPEKYKDAIFIIDDPVCSTSYGNFFGICNLLKAFESEIFSTIWSDEPKPKIQKIILSHNTQFFNMLRNNIFKKGIYLSLDENELKIIPKDRLLSEFKTALIRIHQASQKDDYNGNIGNDMRRFLETLKHFYGFPTFNVECLNFIFSDFDPSRHAIFYSAVNYYSHGNPEGDTESFPQENISKLLEEFVSLMESSQFINLWKEIVEINQEDSVR